MNLTVSVSYTQFPAAQPKLVTDVRSLFRRIHLPSHGLSVELLNNVLIMALVVISRPSLARENSTRKPNIRMPSSTRVEIA